MWVTWLIRCPSSFITKSWFAGPYLRDLAPSWRAKTIWPVGPQSGEIEVPLWLSFVALPVSIEYL